ncbi:hypothetical protein CMI37_03555 [Candidatus Pacearchaeota archaeon]|nr:hypothetical protein [Candidatus Pacearchaeota archaeon]
MIRVHQTVVGTYHPVPGDAVAWGVNDTRGYMDAGPSCDECGDCDCIPCTDSGFSDLHLECTLDHPACVCAEIEDVTGEMVECVGLPFAYVCLDGGDVLCEECAEQEGLQVLDCNC